jgi:hypothetical protein
MHMWEFSKALHFQRQNGWARFVSIHWPVDVSPERSKQRRAGPLAIPLPTCFTPRSQVIGPSSMPWRPSRANEESVGHRFPWHG